MSAELPVRPASTAASEPEPIRWSRPPVDVFDGDDRVVFLLDVPGATAETLELNAGAQRLTLAAPVGDGRGWRRTFELGEHLDVDAVDARLDSGVLQLSLPKRQAPAPRRIEVQR